MTTATSRALLPKRAIDSHPATSTHVCIFPRRTMSSKDANTVSAAGAGNAGKHIPDYICIAVLAWLSDCCGSQPHGHAAIQLVTLLKLHVF